MNTLQLAQRLVELCRLQQFEAAQKELYADDAISIEAQSTEDFGKETRGLQAIIEKGRKFDEMTSEIHSVTISEPVVGGNYFAFSLQMDITMKNGGRTNMSELCVYKAKDGKIVSEEFFM